MQLGAERLSTEPTSRPRPQLIHFPPISSIFNLQHGRTRGAMIASCSHRRILDFARAQMSDANVLVLIEKFALFRSKCHQPQLQRSEGLPSADLFGHKPSKPNVAADSIVNPQRSGGCRRLRSANVTHCLRPERNCCASALVILKFTSHNVPHAPRRYLGH